MNNKKSIIIPLKLCANDIRKLSIEYEQNSSSFITIFIEEILKTAYTVATETKESCIEILKENPFSKMDKIN